MSPGLLKASAESSLTQFLMFPILPHPRTNQIELTYAKHRVPELPIVPKALGHLVNIKQSTRAWAFGGSKCLVHKAFICIVSGQTKKQSSRNRRLKHFFWTKKKNSNIFWKLSEKKTCKWETSVGNYVISVMDKSFLSPSDNLNKRNKLVTWHFKLINFK